MVGKAEHSRQSLRGRVEGLLEARQRHRPLRQRGHICGPVQVRYRREGSVGKPCGYGQYTWKNGSTYVGQFVDGLKHGWGKWRKSKESNSNAYEGQYIQDKKQGFGVFRWASGNVYRGQYQADEREGVGQMRWTDDSLYVGQWSRGIQHGFGRMYFPDGTVKEGLFDNNVYKGPVPASAIPQPLLDPNFDIMSLAPPDAVFSPDMKENAPQSRPYSKLPSTSYQPARANQPVRYSTANQKQVHARRQPAATLCSIPIKRTQRPALGHKPQRTMLSRSLAQSKAGRRANPRVTSVAHTRAYYSNARCSSSPPRPFVNQLQRRLQTQTQHNDTSFTQASDVSHRNSVTMSKNHPRVIWKPAGKVHYAEPYKRRRIYL